MPLARAMGMGSTVACAAHSKSVCFFDSAIISSPVIVIKAPAAGPHPRRELTLMPRFGFTCPQLGMAAGALLVAGCCLQLRIAPGLELVPGLPAWKSVGLGHAVPDREKHFQVFPGSAEIPVRLHDVGRLVIVVLRVAVACLPAEIGRLADEIEALVGVERGHALFREAEVIGSI